MPLTPTVILSLLKDYSQCNDDLVKEIRSTVLEPFQPDLSRIQAGQRITKPSRAEFKAMTTKLAPLAMRIVNQSIESLRLLKQKENSKKETPINKKTVQCLIDAASCSISALKHMSASTTLKPLDIEKTMSNLICKIVDLGEYTRALDELVKLRNTLANTVNITTLENTCSSTTTTSTIMADDTTCIKSTKEQYSLSSPRRGFLTESPNRLTETEIMFQSPIAPSRTIQQTSSSSLPSTTVITGELAPVNSPWEDNMLQKYGDLFTLPLDKSINDMTTVLLVLAYQMNTIRSWTDVAEGSLLRHMPKLMERSGNFIDWCLHLMKLDSNLAKKQFGALYRQLCKAASKFSRSEDIVSGKSFALQLISMIALKHSGTASIKSLCNRMVQIGVSYERSTNQCDYRPIQKYCAVILEDTTPDIKNVVELDAYFVLCEYYAYISRKAKSYSGAFYAYKHMIRPLRSLVSDSSDCTYYHAAYAATAKLSLGSVQLDKFVSGNTYADMSTTLNEIGRCLSVVQSAEESYKQSNEFTEQALNSLLKSIDMFRHSCARYYDFTERKLKKKQGSNTSTPNSTPSGRSSLSRTDDKDWSSCISSIVSVLQRTSEVLPSAMRIMKKKPWRGKQKQTASLNEVMSAFVETMVLISRMRFDIDEEDTYDHVYEDLSTAEDMCVFNGFSNGYRWISNAYYKVGVAMYNIEMYAQAVYPMRKACALLEKDDTRATTDTVKLQLCKRYEVLGTCCQKDKRFEDAMKAFKLSLKRLPSSSIENLVKEANSLAIYTLMEKQPIIPKLIERYLRATFTDESDLEISFASEIMDLHQLDSAQKCVVYECELRAMYMLSASFDCSKHQSAIINTLLRHYTAETYPIRRARVLLDKVRHELSKKKSRTAAMKTAISYASDAGKLLHSQSYGNDSNLLQYRRHYLALSSSWAGICAAELDKTLPEYFSTTSPGYFTMAFHQWGALLKDFESIYSHKRVGDEDIKAVYHQIDDIDKLYDHFRMLTDFFAVKQQPVHHISTLRLMLKLNNGLRRSTEDQVSASIIISSNIGRIYSELGYSGKAEVEFLLAEKMIRQKPCSDEAELSYIIFNSSHLAKIGESDKSKKRFNTSRIVWESFCQGDSSNILRNERRQMSRRLMMADAHYTRSVILSQADPSIDQSISDCTTSLRILNYCSRIAQQNMATKLKKSSSPPSDPFADNSSNTTTPKIKDESAIASSISFRESEWIIAQKITACLLQLAELHLIRGSWRDAQYYLEKGQELSEKLHSRIMKFKFLIAISDFHLRCGSPNSSASNLKNAKEIQPEGEIYIREDAELNMAAGNVDADQGCLSDAIKSYDAAEENFNKIMDAGYIATMEDLIQRNEDLIKLKKIIRENDNQDITEYTCNALQNIRGTNTIYKAMALAQEKSLSEALTILEELEKSNIMTKNELELHAAIAQLQSMLVYLDLQDCKGGHLPNAEVQILPSFKLQQQIRIKRSAIGHELRHIQNNLTHTFERILRTHRATAYQCRIQVVRELCLLAGSLMFPQNHFTGRDNINVRNYATLSAYYLNMSKGLTMRREMQRCLKSKLESLSGKRPGDNEVKWPENIIDNIDEDDNNDPMEIDGLIMQAPSLYGNNHRWLQGHLEYLRDTYNEEHDLDDSEFQKKFVDIIPPNWTVCSLTMNPNTNELSIVRLQAEKTSTVIKLSLQRTRRSHNNTSENTMGFVAAIDELKQIISESDKTISTAKFYTEKTAVNEWWKRRMQLDHQLKRLLNTIETEWLGGFKGMLCGNYHEDSEGLKKFQRKLNQLLHNFVYGLPPNSTREKSQKMIDINLNMCRVFLRLGPDPSSRELDDIIDFLLSCYESQGVDIDYNRADIVQLKNQLKGEINRYHETASIKNIDTMTREQNDHVILIPDNHLHPIPWESLPIMRSQPVSRLPCLSFLRDRIMRSLAANDDDDNWTEVSINSKKTCYVLNPSGDLMHTQNEFETAFKNMDGWQGLIQEKPVELQWQNMLESRDLYMYFGHSAGQSIIRGQNIKKLKHCPVAILMGCSSGTLVDKGEYDTDGYIMNYLLGGSPAVVANLWDVTDKSIDQLTGKMFNTWGLLKNNNNNTNNNISLVEAVSSSRDACTLPYLIGAAPIIYGIPVYIKRS